MEPSQSTAGARRVPFFVLQTGIITTAIVLLGVYLLTAYADFYLMGLYLWFILPLGALIVGALAGSGYGLASLFTGVKIGRYLLIAVLLLQVGAYFGSQYIEFLSYDLVYEDTGEPVSFADWFHISTVSMEWSRRGATGERLGMWGYGLRLLELAGFAGGGLIVPAILMAAPYCERCQRYMSKRTMGLIPASVPAKNLKKAAPELVKSYEAEQQQAMDDATACIERMFTAASEGDGQALHQEMAPFQSEQKAIGSLPCRIEVTLAWCKGCHSGTLIAAALTGQSDSVQRTELAQAPVPATVVRGIISGHPAAPPPAELQQPAAPDQPAAT